jgi:hypothetical protein
MLNGFAERQKLRVQRRAPLHEYLRDYSTKRRAKNRAERDAQRAAAAAQPLVPLFPRRDTPTIQVPR